MLRLQTIQLKLFVGDNLQSEIWSNPAHPYTIAANITWAVLIGWEMVLFHIFFAIIQAMTIVGIGTAITNIRLATYVM